MNNIRAVLLDLQGVLYADGVAVDGSVDAVRALTESGMQVRFLTNTTTRPRRAIVGHLADLGFEIPTNRVFSPALAAVAVLRAAHFRRLMLAAEPTLAEDFAGFDLVDDDADAVVMGDLYRSFDWEVLNRIFSAVEHGARLIALHQNRYCRRNGDIALDLGPFVAAIEYAAGVEADIVGKPNAAFFASALEDCGVDPAHAVMVGDDPFTDIDGAADAGLLAVQVRTGKYRAGKQGRHAPDAIINSIAGLPSMLGL